MGTKGMHGRHQGVQYGCHLGLDNILCCLKQEVAALPSQSEFHKTDPLADCMDFHSQAEN